MKLTLSFAALCLLATSVATAGPLTKLPDPKAPKDAVNVAPGGSRWSVGAGVVVREIDGNFTLRPTGALPTPRRVSGRGDVGLHRGGGNVITYDDGYVGPGYGFGDGNTPDGTSYVQINSPGQFTNTGRINTDGDPIYNLAFHTDHTFYQSSYHPKAFHSSDEEVGVGPYLEVRYAAFHCPKTNLDVNVMLGYSWVSADLGSGTGVLANQSLNRVTDNYTYNYDYDIVSSGALGGPFPFQDGAYAIGDPSGSYNDGTYFGPRQEHDRSSHTVAQYVLLGHASLDVDLHEIVLAPEVQFHLGQRLHVGLSVGPTVNFISSDFDATASWYKKGSDKAIKTYEVHDSGTEVEVGVASQLTLMFDLTERLFLQASGSYRYVPTVDVGTGFGTAEIDTTAWQGAVGFGIRL